jgi:hypothetical protein
MTERLKAKAPANLTRNSMISLKVLIWLIGFWLLVGLVLLK